MITVHTAQLLASSWELCTMIYAPPSNKLTHRVYFWPVLMRMKWLVVEASRTNGRVINKWTFKARLKCDTYWGTSSYGKRERATTAAAETCWHMVTVNWGDTSTFTFHSSIYKMLLSCPPKIKNRLTTTNQQTLYQFFTHNTSSENFPNSFLSESR